MTNQAHDPATNPTTANKANDALTITAPRPAKTYQPNLVTKATGLVARTVMSLPAPLLGLLGSRTNTHGDTLDPQVIASLKMLEIVHGEDFADLPPEQGRKMIDDEAYLGSGPMPAVASIEDQEINGVPVRVYRPLTTGYGDQGQTGTQALPALVYLHGGGWVLGSLNSHESTCRWLCAAANVVVVAVDYRLAPEHPFPAGLDDVVTVVEAVMTAGSIAGVDHTRVAVGGDSAGGNLTAAACLRLRDEGKAQPALQLLFVPVTNLAEMDTVSYQEFHDGLFLTTKQMRWYADHYVPNPEDRTNPYVSPLFAENLEGLAPAYVAVAGFDPLRDEGEAYAARLQAAGVPTTLVRHRGMVHPFVNSTGVWSGARTAMDQAAGALRLALGMSTTLNDCE